LVHKAAGHDGPFDEAWLQAAFDEFYVRRVRGAQLVTRLFLNDPEFAEHGELFFGAASASSRFASNLFGLLDDPRRFEPAAASAAAARNLITEFAGEPADEVLARFVAAGRFERSRLA